MFYRKRRNEEGELLLSPEDSDKSTPTRSRRRHYIQVLLIICGVLLTFVIGGIAGYQIGYRGSTQYGLLSKTNLQVPDTTDTMVVPPGSVYSKWQHNFTFTRKPGTESEAAWGSLIPIGRGFIYHPQLAPHVANIAMFHQLHCLHTIYVAYYQALESPAVSNLTAVQDFDETTGTRTAVFHIRHCIDYIRQSILCAADTNLEVLDPITHATNGWNQTKQCRSYDSIVEWAEQHANTTDTGITS